MKDDPVEWMAKLANIRKRLGGMGHAINEESFMVKVLTSLPKEYDSWVEDRETDLENGVLTIATLQTKLMEKFEKIKNKQSTGADAGLTAQQKQMADLLSKFSDGEMANFMKQFKKRCTHCGKQGHKAKNCWSLEVNSSKCPAN